MKQQLHLKILLAIFCLSINVQAQSPIINRANYFGIGDSVLLYHKIDTTLNSFTVGAAGTNVLWNFSTMNFNHPSVSTDTLFYISPVGTPFYPNSLSADYSLSNLCFLRKTFANSTENNDYNYYFSNNDSIAFIGHWANNGGTELWEDHCANFIKELSFPFSYPNNFLDSYSRNFFDMSGSDGHYITGTNSVTVDGYGSLITPDGITLNNILRIHSIKTVRDSNFLFGISNYTRHNYRWYSSDKKGFILSMEMTQNNSAIQTADYQKQFNFNTSINNIAANSNSLIIYPNPFSSSATLQADNLLKDATLTVYNSVGQQVKQIKNISGQTVTLHRDNLSSGLYFIRLTQDNKIISGDKLVITDL